MVVTAHDLEKEFHSLCLNPSARNLLSTGFSSLDDLVKIAKRYLMIVTGYPSSGKSEFVDAVMLNMSLQHSWRNLYFSPENYPIQEHIAKLAEKLIGKSIREMNQGERTKALNFLNTHFAWIDLEFPTIDDIFAKAKHRKETLGLDCLVIDPWNGVFHQRGQLREDEYLMETLSRLLTFARRQDIFVCVVAHPKTPVPDKDGKIPEPTLYSISGGAMWRNKADYGIVVHRPDLGKHQLEVRAQKIKQKHMGRVGFEKLDYDWKTGRLKGIKDKEFLLPTDCPAPF